MDCSDDEDDSFVTFGTPLPTFDKGKCKNDADLFVWQAIFGHMKSWQPCCHLAVGGTAL